MKSMRGFTLIELMIVVAIIGILAALASAAYQDYTIRSQVSEGLNLAHAVQQDVAGYFADTGSWPIGITGPSPGLAYANQPSGKYVSGIDVLTGTIRIAFSNAAGHEANAAINGKFLDLRPTVSPNNDVIWTCGLSVVAGADPIGTAAATANGTTILPGYLPQSCRP